ncbi:MAG TPA: hypothetical protein VFE60_04030 [Roseiarcus sp.]|jgi:hypothetical protein|nr:hypothetical protein [Roseiarcus sp.]
MNDLSLPRSDDLERDRRAVDLVIGGKRVDDVAQTMACTVANVNLALDRAAQAYLTAEARVRSIFVDAMRLERAQEACVPAANAGDDKAIHSLTKLSERRCTLLGLNAPIRVDPIQLGESTGPKLTSTQELRRIFDDLRSKNKNRLRNGCEGYGHNSWQDIQDREEMARERENADDDE